MTTMNQRARTWWGFWLRAVAAGAWLGLSAGCLSTKYRVAPKDTPPAVAMKLHAVQPPLAAELVTVIVQKGPGSWKQEAYWDEYVFTLTNRGDAPLTVGRVRLVDALDAAQVPGDDPWKLEVASRENIRKFEHVGRKVVVGAGLTLAWVATPGLVYSAAVAGVSPLLALSAGAAALVALPAWAVGTGVRTLAARGTIREEFERRQWRLPLVLAAGETRSGSWFFPISPGPRRVELSFESAENGQTLAIDLTALAGLHFLKQAAGAPVEVAR